MVTIKDITDLPVFDRIWLACPCASYEQRQVINCGTLDYEPFFDDYNVFVPGEFIFTTLGFAKADPALAEDAVIKVLKRGIAGLAIKPVALTALTPRMEEASKELGVPIFFYDGRYLERIITQAMNLIDEDAEASKLTSLIDALLAPSDGSMVRSLMLQIADATGAAVQCIACAPDSPDAASQRALLGQLEALLEGYARRFPDVESASALLYNTCALGFISFSRKPQSVITIEEADLCKLASQLKGAHCGISQELPLEEGDLCIRQAIAAQATAKAESAEAIRWSALRLDAFHAAAATDRLFSRTSRLIFDLIREYDEEHGSDLLVTANAYAEAFGDVKATSDALIQHPNTVRYRLRKIKEATHSSFLTDKEMAVVLTMAKIATERI